MLHSKSPIYFLLICLAVAFVMGYFVIKPFFGPLILAAVLAFLFQSVYHRLLQFTRGRQNLAALATMVSAIILVLLPMVFLGNQIFKESSQLYNVLTGENNASFVDAIENLANKIPTFVPLPENFSLDLNQYLKQGLSILAHNIGNIFSGFAKMTLNFLVFLIAAYYLLKDGQKLKDYFVALSPLKDSDDEMIASRVKAAVSAVVKGNLLIGLIQGVLTGIGFALFSVPHPVLWGSIAAIAALIPGIGTALVLTPAIVFLFLTGNNFGGWGLLAWGITAVGLVDNFLGPKLIGSGMRLHPLAAFLAVIGGLVFFGPLGILLGPLVIGICLALIEIYFSLKTQETD